MIAQEPVQPIAATLFNDVFGRDKQEVPWSPDLINERDIYPNKQTCPLLKLALFGNLRSDKDSLRHDENVQALSGVECDYDGEQHDMATAAARLEEAGIHGLFYTSTSHLPDKPRWRLLLPFSKAHYGTPGQLRALRRAVIEKVEGITGVPFAPESHSLSQAFYFGVVQPVHFQRMVTDGLPVDLGIDVARLMVEKPATPALPPTQTPEQFADTMRLLESVDPDIERPQWLAIGMAIKSKHGDPGFPVWDNWSSRGSKYTTTEELWKTWQSFKREGVGSGTLAHIAREHGAQLSQPLKLVTSNDKPHPWLSRTTTFSRELLERKPEPREMLCGYFPVRATSAVVAAGGVGKTTWLNWLVAQHVSDDFHVLFVTAEDGEEDYHAKLHNLLYCGLGLGLRMEDIENRIHVLNLKGAGAKLVAEQGGSYVPSVIADDVISYAREHYPQARLISFETVSRFAGGEDNERMEALVSACDRIAIAINGACVVVHHTGKGQAREKIIDLYSSRGGSALGDNTRSFVVLTRLGGDYMGELPVVIDPDDIEAGRAFEVYHVRNSYGVRREPVYFVTRQGRYHGPVLEVIPIANTADMTRARVEALDAQNNKAASAIHDVIKAKGGKVPRKFFDTSTKALIGITQEAGRKLIDEMLEAGSLCEVEEFGKRGQRPKFLKIDSINKGV